MEVSFARAAEHDLEAIGDWIALDHPSRAFTFVEDLRDRARSLAAFPERFPVSHRGRDGVALRRLNHEGYRVLYQVLGRKVIIVRILHGARDDPA